MTSRPSIPFFRHALASSFVLASLCGANIASAQEDFCPLYEEIDNTQLLRRLSLDLRRLQPTYEEYEALGEAPVDKALIDAYIESDEFSAMVRRFHMDMLWSNVANVAVSTNNSRLTTRNLGNGTSVLAVAGAARRQIYRGDPNAFCADYEQTEWCSAADMQNGTPGCDGEGLPRKNAEGLDGWVNVQPYWDPASCTNNNQCVSGQCNAGSCAPMKACAFDAQTAEHWDPDGGPPDETNDCNFLSGIELQGCGCGPNMRYCWGNGVEQNVKAAMGEQVMRLIEDATMGDLSYSQMLTTQRTYYNGPLYFWKRHLAQMTSLNQTFNFHMEGDVPQVENPNYLDETWSQEQRSDVHAGIMTMPGFTLRFQTNRGRANRFRTVFMGQYFEPPAGSDTEGCDAETNDLTEQCGCRHCHSVLEPMAAYFGNISEAGSALLSDRDLFPLQLSCGNPQQLTAIERALCIRFYVNDPNQDNVGALLPLQYAGDDTEAHQAIGANFEAGPIALAQSIIDDGTFARTSVLSLWRYFMQREMNLDPLNPDNELELLETLTTELREHDNFKQIVKRLVSLEQYRRTR